MTPPHRLVTIGDSLTHGFQSLAICNTHVSYPAIIAHELGFTAFRYPRYEEGGLPVNVEELLRRLEEEYGPQLPRHDLFGAAKLVHEFMDRVEDYWERGPGSEVPANELINHNLAVYGYDLRDALDKTAADCLRRLTPAHDNLLNQVPEHNTERAALRVFPTAPAAARDLTLLAAARQLGEANPDGDAGIETLVVFLGANNALGCITSLKVCWSGPGYDDPDRKAAFTVWRPTDFIRELHLVRDEVARIRARHVIWCTVPHVTIAPLARGVGEEKIAPGSRYFPYYTWPWIPAEKFRPGVDPALTAAQARAVDSAIDQYNEAIVDVVRNARLQGRDWRVCDAAGVLDRLASRRYIQDEDAQPSWWKEHGPYPLPPALAALAPQPDSRFLTADENGRATGGLFSLDGVHPTTVAYGILAQELINVMSGAGVVFREPNGTPRDTPVTVDFDRLIAQDMLVTSTPLNVTAALEVVGWIEREIGLVRQMTHQLRRSHREPEQECC